MGIKCLIGLMLNASAFGKIPGSGYALQMAHCLAFQPNNEPVLGPIFQLFQNWHVLALGNEHYNIGQQMLPAMYCKTRADE